MSTADEFPEEDVEYDPERNEDVDRVLAGAEGGDDEEIVIDYNPESRLIPKGDYPATLTAVEAGQTSGFGGSKVKPAIKWTVMLSDERYPFPRTKVVPITDGGGIERLNIAFAGVLGIQCTQTPDGKTRFPMGQVRRKLPFPITARIDWYESKTTGEMQDSLAMIIPAADQTLPGLDDEDEF